MIDEQRLDKIISSQQEQWDYIISMDCDPIPAATVADFINLILNVVKTGEKPLDHLNYFFCNHCLVFHKDIKCPKCNNSQIVHDWKLAIKGEKPCDTKTG